ncbi:MAG: hypothetical protein ACJ74O_07670 [Frankiaceae bacterium]
MRAAALAALALTGLCTFVVTRSSEASTSDVDLSMTGSVVAGVTGAQPSQELAFVFTLKNKSTTTPAATDFTFTVKNGTVSGGEDYVCPLVGSRYDIFPDTPACEPGTLGPGKTTRAAILVETPSAPGVTMTVRACASDELGSTDPVPSNNCKTLRVPIS